MIYSQRPKSELSGFRRLTSCSVAKMFGFRTRPITEQNRLVCQTQKQFQTGLELFLFLLLFGLVLKV